MFCNRCWLIVIGFLGLVLISSDNLAAQDPVRPKRYDVKKTYAPSPIPDRIILTWSGNPATTQSVTWRTDNSVKKAFAEYAIAKDGPKFINDAVRIAAVSTELETNLGNSKYHTAVMKDLKPETKYLYRVGDGTNWSEWSEFQTASDQAKPFSFIYFGDAQNNIKSHWSRVIRQAFRDAPRAAFLLHAGDLVNGAHNDIEWSEWFYSAGWINRTMPSIATPGNHEYSRGKLSMQWNHVFDFPTNGPKSLPETVYYIDYQGVRFISLNSNVDYDVQAKWFKETMKANKNRWTLITMHHPIFSTNARRDNKRLREKFKPLFDKYKIDLVLQGHDHAYGRTGLVKHDHEHDAKGRDILEKQGKKTVQQKPVEQNVATGVTARSEKSGTVYVVSVSGPKMYSIAKKPVFKKMAQSKQLYQVISIDGDKLTFSAYTATGKLFDRFQLIKQQGQANRLVEGKVSK